MLILKLNKEAPYRKDVFRAPGHQGAMKKLTHFLQTGRLVNMDNFSVYTIASVLKKFLRKVPGGVFGRDIEHKFFQVIELTDIQAQQDEIHRWVYLGIKNLFMSSPPFNLVNVYKRGQYWFKSSYYWLNLMIIYHIGTSTLPYSPTVYIY